MSQLLRKFNFSIARPDQPTKLKNAVSQDYAALKLWTNNYVQGIWLMEDFWLRVEHREV